jgi:hypothetical protein
VCLVSSLVWLKQTVLPAQALQLAVDAVHVKRFFALTVAGGQLGTVDCSLRHQLSAKFISHPMHVAVNWALWNSQCMTS